MREAELWREIRALRAAPPGLAGADPRRAVFTAALQQSQELMAAAETAGPASRPITLFYSLSQAGRAIAAARAPNPTWEIRGHGLAVTGTSDVAQTQVRPNPNSHGSDAYALVAAATGSEALASTVPLAALWAALPELDAAASLTVGATPALEVVPSGMADVHPKLQPHEWTPATVSVPGVRQADLAELMPRYALTDGWQVAGAWMDTAHGRSGPVVRWELGRGQGGPMLRALGDFADHIDGRWYLRPLMGQPPQAPSRLMTWWALLLALSSLARYHPSLWVAALDVDRSPHAVALEQCLEVAVSAVVPLILDALNEA
jgi:hypothetical protein